MPGTAAKRPNGTGARHGRLMRRESDGDRSAEGENNEGADTWQRRKSVHFLTLICTV